MTGLGPVYIGSNPVGADNNKKLKDDVYFLIENKRLSVKTDKF